MSPTLTTPRLVLRPFTLADAPDLQRLAGDREVAATTLRIPHPYDDGLAEAWIARILSEGPDSEMARFAITQRSDEVLVGSIGLNVDRDHEHGELGYWIGKPYWNKGYATEAARAVVAYGFRELGLRRIHAHHFAENAASGRVLQKIGMRHEGRLRQHYKKWDTFHDVDAYGILRDEFLALDPQDTR